MVDNNNNNKKHDDPQELELNKKDLNDLESGKREEQEWEKEEHSFYSRLLDNLEPKGRKNKKGNTAYKAKKEKQRSLEHKLKQMSVCQAHSSPKALGC